MGCNSNGQRIVDGDLFIINRPTLGGADTYKVTANDIGIFLSGQTVDGTSGDRYVNDGPINIYGYDRKAVELDASITLHSANEPCEGALMFSDDFSIRGVTHNINIKINLPVIVEKATKNSVAIESNYDTLDINITGLMDLLGVDVYADNDAAQAAGLAVGEIYYDERLKKLRTVTSVTPVIALTLES